MHGDTGTLTLDQFWRWLGAHYNCIIRAGGEGAVLFDHPYLHWHLLEEDDGQLVVQLVRGKDLIAELVIDPKTVMYVESSPQEGEQVLFELIGGNEGEAYALFHFLMAHGFEDDRRATTRWTH